MCPTSSYEPILLGTIDPFRPGESARPPVEVPGPAEDQNKAHERLPSSRVVPLPFRVPGSADSTPVRQALVWLAGGVFLGLAVTICFLTDAWVIGLGFLLGGLAVSSVLRWWASPELQRPIAGGLLTLGLVLLILGPMLIGLFPQAVIDLVPTPHITLGAASLGIGGLSFGRSPPADPGSPHEGRVGADEPG